MRLRNNLKRDPQKTKFAVAPSSQKKDNLRMGKGANASSKVGGKVIDVVRKNAPSMVVDAAPEEKEGDGEKMIDNNIIPGRKYTQIRGKTYDITEFAKRIPEGVNS